MPFVSVIKHGIDVREFGSGLRSAEVPLPPNTPPVLIGYVLYVEASICVPGENPGQKLYQYSDLVAAPLVEVSQSGDSNVSFAGST